MKHTSRMMGKRCTSVKVHCTYKTRIPRKKKNNDNQVPVEKLHILEWNTAPTGSGETKHRSSGKRKQPQFSCSWVPDQYAKPRVTGGGELMRSRGRGNGEEWRELKMRYTTRDVGWGGLQRGEVEISLWHAECSFPWTIWKYRRKKWKL